MKEKENEIKRIQAAILSEGQQRISFDEARHLWTRYSGTIGLEWAEVPGHPINIYCLVEGWVIQWVYLRERQ